jgi:hypothetical protein
MNLSFGEAEDNFLGEGESGRSLLRACMIGDRRNQITVAVVEPGDQSADWKKLL